MSPSRRDGAGETLSHDSLMSPDRGQGGARSSGAPGRRCPGRGVARMDKPVSLRRRVAAGLAALAVGTTLVVGALPGTASATGKDRNKGKVELEKGRHDKGDHDKSGKDRRKRKVE